MVSFENLLLAFLKASKGKKSNPQVGDFAFRLEEELLLLQRELMEKTYSPGPYRTFYIYEKKKRMISAAPFRDRVVHHALCNIIGPIFERGFIYDSYANRVGKGTHRAVQRCSEFARKNPYVLKLDIKKYFPSIDHEILKGLIRRRIKDPEVLWLCDLVIDSSNPQEQVLEWFPGDDLFAPVERRKGLPIGNQTSQFFANLYLDPLDHFVKEVLGCRYYIRYVDDILVLGPEKGYLWDVKEEISGYLEKLRLKLRAQVFPVRCGIPFLGYVVFPGYRRLRPQNVRDFRRRLRELQRLYACGELSLERLRCSINGWLGHAMHADTYRLCRSLLGKAVFSPRYLGPPKSIGAENFLG